MGSTGPKHIGDFEVLVIGGGFCGVWLLNELRKEGFNVRLFEAGTALGGIWHWNAYPGARVDTPVPTYQLTSNETWQNWDWKERFPGRDELAAYFRNIEKVWGLSEDISYQTRLTSMRFDPDSARWNCVVNDGEGECSAWQVVLCTGFASKRYIPSFKNMEAFEGEMHHTGVWPQEGVSLKGRRIAVIGTGATGVQVTQEVAKEASQFTVFQRTPNSALPMLNPDVDNETVRSGFGEVKKKMEETFAGFDYEFIKTDKHPSEIPKEERMRVYEELYNRGGAHLWLGNYMLMLFDEDLNEETYQFWRSKTLPRINDPAKAEILAPEKKPHPFGTKRISLEQGFFEAFNQDNADLVDLHANPIAEFTPAGIKTSDGKMRDFDLIILATGFDAVTGGITQIDIQNPSGRTIKDKWEKGVYTYLGMATNSFPNLLWTYGVQAPTAFATGPKSAETQGAWIVHTLKHLRENGYKTIDATPEAEQEWRKHVNEVANMGLFNQAESWYFGANIPGKQREAMNFMGGLPDYRKRIWDMCANEGYKGFVLAR